MSLQISYTFSDNYRIKKRILVENLKVDGLGFVSSISFSPSNPDIILIGDPKGVREYNLVRDSQQSIANIGSFIRYAIEVPFGDGPDNFTNYLNNSTIIFATRNFNLCQTPVQTTSPNKCERIPGVQAPPDDLYISCFYTLRDPRYPGYASNVIYGLQAGRSGSLKTRDQKFDNYFFKGTYSQIGNNPATFSFPNLPTERINNCGDPSDVNGYGKQAIVMAPVPLTSPQMSDGAIVLGSWNSLTVYNLQSDGQINKSSARLFATTTNGVPQGFGAGTSWSQPAFDPRTGDMLFLVSINEQVGNAYVASRYLYIISGFARPYGYDLAPATNFYGTGINDQGAVGLGSFDSPIRVFTKTGKNQNIKNISVGENFALAVQNDGTLIGAGLNSKGQLGLGDEQKFLNFTPIWYKDNCLKVSCGKEHSLLLNTQGYLSATGSSIYGQLGLGSGVRERKIFSDWSTVRYYDIAAGATHSLVIRYNDRQIYAAGDNTYGQLGIAFNQNISRYETFTFLSRNQYL